MNSAQQTRRTGETRKPRRRLLLVEDDPGVSYALKLWLDRQGVLVVDAGSVQEAVELLRDMAFIESAFDALLTDHRLPDGVGSAVLDEFTRLFPETPAALMTAFADEDLESALRARSVPLFRKPLRTREVQNWLDTVPCPAN